MAMANGAPDKTSRRCEKKRKRGQAVPAEMNVDALRARLAELVAECESPEQLIRIVEAVEAIASETD